MSQSTVKMNAPLLTASPSFADRQSRRESPKWLLAHFNFERRNALKSERERSSTLRDWSPCPPIRRAAVKVGCKPVYFSPDGCLLSCYFSESVVTTLEHFVHKAEGRTRDEGFHIRPVCWWNQTCSCDFTPHKHSPVFLSFQMPLFSTAATAFLRQCRQSV